MTDLGTQLRDYIDGIASPIPSPADHARSVPPASRRRGGRRRMVAVAVGVSLIALVAGVVLRGGPGSSPVRIRPNDAPARALPLTAEGTADCRAVQPLGSSVLVGVVAGGHAICVVSQGAAFEVYFDGRQRMSSSMPAAGHGGGGFGGLDSRDGRVFGFGWDFPLAGTPQPDAWRVTFCDGTTVEAPPLAAEFPHFYGVEYDATLGSPSTVGLVDGRPIGASDSGGCAPSTTGAEGTAEAAASVALTALGPADCSRVRETDDTLLLAVTVEAGHRICVTQHGNATSNFLDDVPGGGSSGGGASDTGAGYSGGGIGTDHGRLVYLSSLPTGADGQRLTFCDGSTLTLRPLNTGSPRYVGALIDTSHSYPLTVVLEGDTPIRTGPGHCPPATTGGR